MIFDLLTPTQGHQFDPRVKYLFVSYSTHPLPFDMLHDLVFRKIEFLTPRHLKLEFRMSPVKTEVKQGKVVEFISPAKGYFRETYKSQNINPIFPTPKLTLGIIQIKVESLATKFQCLVQ